MNPIGQETSRVGGYDARQLHALLKEQAEVVSLLTRAASEKQSGILEKDSVKIEGAVAQETELAQRLATLEERRAMWIADWAASLPGIEGGDGLTLSDLLPHLPPEHAGSIQEVAGQLMEAVDELHRINQQNADLVYYSLAHVQTLLGALAGSDQSSGLYGPGAQKGDAQSRALVDWRV